MLVKVVKKLWQGKYASIRDYEHRAAIKEGGIELRHNDDIMTMTAEELSKYKPGNKEFPSKFGKPYKLVDLPFTPKEENFGE